MTRKTFTVVGWIAPEGPHYADGRHWPVLLNGQKVVIDLNDPTATVPLKLMVEDFSGDTRHEAAVAARDELIRINGEYIGRGGVAFAFEKADATIDDANPWEWVYVEPVPDPELERERAWHRRHGHKL